ncbi:draG [Symbiodinium natans]|uniref:DraG protein n=1 Tax=Symbiodinium natans TaxID=878477 RepID=A0A812TSC6_9DINO|nr:draG [Symbiodinium natans]
MWPGLHVPRLAELKGQGAGATESPAANGAVHTKVLKEVCGADDVLLRISTGGLRDFLLPAGSLEELTNLGQLDGCALREKLREGAVAELPGSGLNSIEKFGGSGKLPVCLAGNDVESAARQCEDLGLQPALKQSDAGTKLFDPCSDDGKDGYILPQMMTVIDHGKKVPYLRPRTRLSEKDYAKLSLPGPTRRSAVAAAMGLTEEEPRKAAPALVDDEAALQSKTDKAKDELLRQIDFIVAESALGLVDDLHFLGSDWGRAPFRSSLQEIAQLGAEFEHVLNQEQAPELSLVHEELVASCASVIQEFPSGSIPADRVAEAGKEQPGTVRAKAVRIRGSAESAYPFVKGASQAGSLGQVPQAALQNERMQVMDPDGIQE